MKKKHQSLAIIGEKNEYNQDLGSAARQHNATLIIKATGFYLGSARALKTKLSRHSSTWAKTHPRRTRTSKPFITYDLW